VPIYTAAPEEIELVRLAC